MIALVVVLLVGQASRLPYTRDFEQPPHSRNTTQRDPLLVAGETPAPPGERADSAWVETARDGGVVVSMREHRGSDVKEVLATGTFDASPDKVHAVLDDLEHYKDFMPYTEESRTFGRAPGEAFNYERVNAPLSDKRDYVVHVKCAVDDRGRITHGFTLANDRAPPPMKDVVRVQVLEGHWLLEPVDGGKRTKATYWVYTSPGGSVPAFIVNMANNTAVPNLFAAVRKRLAASASLH